MSRSADLLGQLRNYKAGDATEEGHRLALIKLLEESAEPFGRKQFQPGHVTASCFIVDLEGRLLLHHHRRLDRWLQMGGHVELEEPVEQAALREGREESGLRDLQLVPPILDLDVHAIPAGRGEPGHDHFDVRFLARTELPDSCTMDRNESSNLVWVSLSRAAQLMPGEESHRVLHKIERILRQRSFS